MMKENIEKRNGVVKNIMQIIEKEDVMREIYAIAAKPETKEDVWN